MAEKNLMVKEELHLIHELLCIPPQCARAEMLPDAVKGVFLALDSQRGPLKDFVVVSRILRKQAPGTDPQQPGMLSLLPKECDIWATETLVRCSGAVLVEQYLPEAR